MKTALFLSIISFSLWSAEMQKQAWHHKDDHYLFSYDEKSGAIISLNCMNDELSLEKSTCEAAKIFREKKPVKLPRGALSGGKNPGAVACSLGLKKKILILKDTKNNENSFCQFEDGSMISASNLQTLIKE